MKNLPKVETNDEVFGILEKAGIISTDFAKKAFGMGRFRNILVHGYMIVDVQKVFDNLQKLDLFEDFAKEIGNYLS